MNSAPKDGAKEGVKKMLTDAKRESLKTGDRFWCVAVGKPTRRLFGELADAELTDLQEVVFLYEHPSNKRKENDPVAHAYAIAYAAGGMTDTMVDQLCFDSYNDACTAVLGAVVEEIDRFKAKAVRFEEVRVAARPVKP